MEAIQFIRGDSFSFKFKYQNIKQEEIAEIILTCRKLPTFESPILFQKTLENGDFRIDEEYIHGEFKPEDTELLEYGTYCFDIEVTTTSNYRKTKFGELELLEECTMH